MAGRKPTFNTDITEKNRDQVETASESVSTLLHSGCRLPLIATTKRM